MPLSSGPVRIAFFSLAAILILAAAFSGYRTLSLSNQRADIMDDFSRVNDIRNGLFSVDTWKGEIKKIVSAQIEDFEFSPSQDSILRVQVSELLHSLVDEAKLQIEKDDDTFGKKVRNLAVRTFVDWEDLRDQIPTFTNRILREITKEKNKERLKLIAQQKLDEYATEIKSNLDSLKIEAIYNRYEVSNKQEFNQLVKTKAHKLQNKAYLYTYSTIGLALLFLFGWIPVARKPSWHSSYFGLCVILGLLVLLAGLASPMIEIDARLSKMDFTLLGEHLVFTDQMLYYRSKSILEVVNILINTGKGDSVLVGILILAFSVLLPISKLVSSLIFLKAKNKLRNNKILRWLAFKSGKWSMADVIVVAIFMAYVGFKGILDNQTKGLNYQTDTVTSISTNLTGLQPGFFLFLTFVLFSLILSEILSRVVEKN